MPRYDYVCIQCGATREVQHSITETPEIICEECGEAMVRQISGGGAAVIKGGKRGGGLDAKRDEKFHRDMAYAREKLPWMNQGPQPKIRPQMFREDPNEGAHEAAAPESPPNPSPPAASDPPSKSADD